MGKAASNGNTNGRPAVHLVLQGKGGVGKSFVSSILAQYFRERQQTVHCIDTDPVNATLAQYPELSAEHLNVLRRGAINEREFDSLVEKICREDGLFVIDTGATTFVPLWNYILENEILRFLEDHGRMVWVHSVVTGGQAMSDTLNGFAELAKTTRQKNIIVWLNEYFGEVVGNEGKPFEELKVTQQHAEKLAGAVTLRERNAQTFGADVKQMLERRLTFGSAIRSEDFTLISKQRLAIVRRDLFEQLDKLALI
ncbi:MAG TPA: conjugal transfer protein TraL [Terriglobia bacterium]|nr:conjugal transfer protein TraL [Terriglobia bacterium]